MASLTPRGGWHHYHWMVEKALTLPVGRGVGSSLLLGGKESPASYSAFSETTLRECWSLFCLDRLPFPGPLARENRLLLGILFVCAFPNYWLLSPKSGLYEAKREPGKLVLVFLLSTFKSLLYVYFIYNVQGF